MQHDVALAKPDTAHINQLLAKLCVEHEIKRKDGSPTPPHLPWRIYETEDIGFRPGSREILDCSYSFRPVNGNLYLANIFLSGKARSPEFVTSDKETSRPLKADSWYLG